MRLFFNGPILTMDDEHHYYSDGVLVEDNGRIYAVGERSLLEKYPRVEKVDLKGKLLMPGLINAHIHLSQALLRNQADDMELEPWLFDRVWPFQAAHTTESFLAGARLAMLEMLKSGTTTFVESMVIHYGLDALAEEVEKIGMRAMLSKVVMREKKDILLPPQLRERFSEALGEAVTCKKNRRKDSLVDIWLGPRWTGMYDAELLDLVREAMDEYDFTSTLHYAESAEDVQKINTEAGCSPLQLLADKGLLDRKLLIIHGTCLPDSDLIYLKKSRASLVHCPVSAMKVGMGYANIPAMLANGATVSLGTDAAACNNTHDVFREMRMVALLHKFQQKDSSLMNAETCLGMATKGGAKSLYQSNRIGTLEVGKDADMITINLDAAHLQPFRNPYGALVYCANGSDVSDVYVRGHQLVCEGECLTLDKERVLFEAKKAQLEVANRAGMVL
ncbi:amidohydrolase [Clostridia bacterium]|nr:amidohydrolase [Clostridia bacterium]